MYRFNLNTLNIDENLNKKDDFLILATSMELKTIKERLSLDDDTFNECVIFDENIKLDSLDKYDFLSINYFYIKKEAIAIFKELNMYMSDNYILVVCDEDDSIYSFIKNIMINKKPLDTANYFFSIVYSIFKQIIINQFENLEKLEDIILKIEDDLINDINDIEKINYIRFVTRNIVKNTRPLLYISDMLIKENSRYKIPKDTSKYNIQSLDFSVEKLYTFSLSSRELADKLLDIYSSNVNKKTNDLITKLTLLTAISSPLTIISGVYGMNFKVMPFLEFQYGYYLTLFIMFIIISIGVFKLKKYL